MENQAGAETLESIWLNLRYLGGDLRKDKDKYLGWVWGETSHDPPLALQPWSVYEQQKYTNFDIDDNMVIWNVNNPEVNTEHCVVLRANGKWAPVDCSSSTEGVGVFSPGGSVRGVLCERTVYPS